MISKPNDTEKKVKSTPDQNKTANIHVNYRTTCKVIRPYTAIIFGEGGPHACILVPALLAERESYSKSFKMVCRTATE
jgi:hypothetical protein